MEADFLYDLAKLSTGLWGVSPVSISPLSISGSNRRYFRLYFENLTAIGVYHEDIRENAAFMAFTKHFLFKGMHVPGIYGENLPKKIYILEDLGDITLFSLLSSKRRNAAFPAEAFDLYKQVICELPKFQATGKDLDYSYCHPRAAFDKQSMLWDLNYFKYYFLKLAKVPFDEQAVEDDFLAFSDYLLQADHDFFMYRDFQSRNIMIYKEIPYFIDYQGGRKGALQYDLASLLYDAKADIPVDVRQEFLEYYLEMAGKQIKLDKTKFLTYYYAYAYIRILQAMGAYGFRGFYEKKEHFLQSIPYAMANLQWLMEHQPLPEGLTSLNVTLERVLNSAFLQQFMTPTLTVSINSFSFPEGLPPDESGHGGGYVFDCRALPNPGRFEKFKDKSGKDPEVIEFLSAEEEVRSFLNNIYSIIDQTVKNYLKRNFTHLQVSFGCTGGQHRSVYMAEELARHLKDYFNVNIELRHRELELKDRNSESLP